MEMPERIQLIIKSHNLTASSFAAQLGIQRSSVSHLLSGRNKPSLDVLQKILTHFPRVDAAWLISGEQQKNSSVSTPPKNEDSKIDQSRTTPITNNQNDQKTVISIVKFYSDGSFDSFSPNDSEFLG